MKNLIYLPLITLLVLGFILMFRKKPKPELQKIKEEKPKILDDKKTVIIIGSGIAGLKVATTLKEKLGDKVEFVILEGLDRTGGRILSFKFGDKVLEAGANWIHGLESEETGKINPLWEMAKKADLKGF